MNQISSTMRHISIIIFTAICFTNIIGQNKVGINTSNPEMQLHIASNDSLVMTLQNNETLQNGRSSGMYFKIGNGFWPYTGAIKSIGIADDMARLGFFTFASTSPNLLKERMSIMDSGKVGIGTTNPFRDLHISTSNDEILLLENTSDLENNTETSIIFKTGNGPRSYTGGIKTIGQSTTEARLGLFTSTTGNSAGLLEQMSILNNGKTGIGTKSPDTKLHILSAEPAALTIHNEFQLNQFSDNRINFKSGTSGSTELYTGSIRALGNSSNQARLGLFTFTSSNENNLKERMSIMDSGKVGIGIVDPISFVHVSNNVEDLLAIENSADLDSDVTSSMYYKTGNIYTGAIKTIGANTQASRMGFYTFSTTIKGNLKERMTITDGGNVGIGTTVPGTTLQVDGSLKFVTGDQGEGKVLVSDNQGNAAWKYKSQAGCNLSIGDTHEGGIIFYLDRTGCHGLVAHPTDLPNKLRWSNGTGATDAIGYGIFEGEYNTEKIMSQIAAPNAPAAEACAALNTSGKTDWHLPSRIELDLMFLRLKSNGLGNFKNEFYATSSEVNAVTIWVQNFANGVQDGLFPGNKQNSHWIRPIRSF